MISGRQGQMQPETTTGTNLHKAKLAQPSTLPLNYIVFAMRDDVSEHALNLYML